MSAIVNAAPALNPVRIVSLMKFTNPLSRMSQAKPAKCRHNQRRECGDGSPTRRIAIGHAGDRCADQHGDGRRGTDGQLPRSAEQRIAEAAHEVAINAIVRRQPRERRVRQRDGNRVRGQRDARDHVVLQPGRLVLRQPLHWRQHGGEAAAGAAIRMK